MPVEPIVNSFGKGDRGQFKGVLLANAEIKGAGVTGASLQKALQGRLGFTLTNANIQLAGKKTKTFLVPIAVVLGVPELTQSPLNWLDAVATLGEGKINLTRFNMESDAFRADSAGTITIAEVLTNSPINNLPVNVALSRNLAHKASLLPANTPTSAAYVDLPHFVKVGGTVGSPKVATDKLVITGMIANKAAGYVGGKAGGIIQGVGALLGGQPPAPPSTTTNQPPATNQQQKLNPLDLFKLIPKK